MTVVAFPSPPAGPAHTVAALAALTIATDPRCAIVIVSADGRTRHYRIHQETPGRWIGEVWFAAALHRRKVAIGVHGVRQLVRQFVRELQDLVADGWTER